MIDAAGSFAKLSTGFEKYGGTDLQQDMPYWSSTSPVISSLSVFAKRSQDLQNLQPGTFSVLVFSAK
jgi:hypothetical protein